MPATLISNKENITDSTRLVLIPDSFAEDAGNTFCVLATPRISPDHCLESTNCTDNTISNP